ncbi:hypothetical protein O181_035395 [Austropuccinia psidii MF-1]|uniref:Uncharacterized protein n=1 Tax=Austropuccinia psidii MF-1 TaxID=1389203 RepID=A0A9Q3D6T4_9BASI|nr:hypothetical protein [Austropuccinia psidii MF-1]
MKMVHTRNGTNYSVQTDESGQVRGKTRAIYGKSSSRRRHLEDTTVVFHSQRSLPNNFEINSEPKLIQGNSLRFKPFTSRSYRNISVPVQKLVQRSQERGVGNIPKPLTGAINYYLHIKSFLCQERNIGILGGWTLSSCKDKVKKIRDWLKNQSILSIDQKKELKMTPALGKEVPVASTSIQRQAQRTLEKAYRS